MTTVQVGKHGRFAGWWRIQAAIDNGYDFSNSSHSFTGQRETLPGRELPTGHMPEEHRAVLFTARKVDYVIRSYRTPIAWRWEGTDEWVCPAVHYSTTTSNHQAQARTAISKLTPRYASPVVSRGAW